MKRLLTIVLLVGLSVACASTGSRKTFLTHEEWAAAVRERGVDPDAIPNPLFVTEEMRQAAVELAGFGSAVERLNRLQQSLFDADRFPFSYETRGTLTAAEAYYRRQGNCLSFTNLFVALGRSIGIPVTTALVLRARGSEQEGDLIVVNTHVVATLASTGENVYYDFERSRRQEPVAVRTLGDLWITALYLNNLGSDELRSGHSAAALEFFESAVKLAPDFGSAWGNLGVARRRAGNISGAFDAYRQALALDPDNPTILANLAALYGSLGRREEAEAALQAANLSKASAHVLVVRGYLELTRGQVSAAHKLFKRARRMAPKAAEPLVALARAEVARGNHSGALKYLEQALEINPNHEAARSLQQNLLHPPGAVAPGGAA